MEMDLGERIRELRGERSQNEFAEFINVSRPSVGLYENGRRVPDASIVSKICQKCGVTSDWLLGLSEYKSREQEETIIGMVKIKGRLKAHVSLLSNLPASQREHILLNFETALETILNFPEDNQETLLDHINKIAKSFVKLNKHAQREGLGVNKHPIDLLYFDNEHLELIKIINEYTEALRPALKEKSIERGQYNEKAH
jgi:transcriptional regulator with XRE-family HTH domain